MRRVLVSVLALVALVALADQLAGHSLASLYRRSPSEEDGDWFGRGARHRPALVVCGSSRALFHYEADSLESRLGVRVYNFGKEGQFGALFVYGVVGMLLEQQTPRLCVIEADERICEGPEETSRLSGFLPYVHESPTAAELARLHSKYEALRLLSAIYPYNSRLLGMLAPYLGKRPVHRLGFVPLAGTLAPAAAAQATADAPAANAKAPAWSAPDTQKLRYLRRTVALARRHGVALVAVRGPRCVAGPGAMADDAAMGAHLARVFADLGVRFIDFPAALLSDTTATPYFHDADHLNARGARRFTAAFTDSLGPLRERLLRR